MRFFSLAVTAMLIYFSVRVYPIDPRTIAMEDRFMQLSEGRADLLVIGLFLTSALPTYLGCRTDRLPGGCALPFLALTAAGLFVTLLIVTRQI